MARHARRSTINDNFLLLTEFVNLEALVLNSLLITAYSNVSVNHFFLKDTKESVIDRLVYQLGSAAYMSVACLKNFMA